MSDMFQENENRENIMQGGAADEALEIKDEAVKAAEQTVQTAEQTAGQIAQDEVKAAEQGAGQTVQAADRAVQDAVKAAKQTVQDAVRTAAHTVQDSAKTAEQTVRDAEQTADQTVQAADQTAQDAVKTVQTADQTVQAAAPAAGIAEGTAAPAGQDAAAGAAQAGKAGQDGSFTYSWVNPRLRRDGGQAASHSDPWNGAEHPDYYWSGRQNDPYARSNYTGRNAGSQQNQQGGQAYTQNRGTQPDGRTYTQNTYSGQPYTPNSGAQPGGRTYTQNTQNGPTYTQNAQNSPTYTQNAQNGPTYAQNAQNGPTYAQDAQNSQNAQNTGNAYGYRQNPYGYSQNQTDNRTYGYYSNGRQAVPGGSDAGKKVKKPRKPMTTARKWLTTVAMAVVFGLIAGLIMLGIGSLGRGSSAASASAGSAVPKQEEQIQSVPQIAQAGQAGEDAAKEDAAESAAGTKTESSATGKGPVADVAATVKPSMVTISTMSVEQMQSIFGGIQEYEAEGAGSGIIVGQNDKELLIATNNHVVEGATEVSVGFVDDTAVPAFIKGKDSTVDLAVVGVKLDDIPAETRDQIRIVELGDSDDLVVGEQVVAIGNALGLGQSVTSGYVSAIGRELELYDGRNYFKSTDLIQVDAAINSGNSGGALLNMRGQLVGINEAKASTSSSGASVDNVGYAIPISKARPILEQLMTLETREKITDGNSGYLGVTCADVTSEYSQMYNMPEGVCFTSVIEDGPAEAAGAMKGDVLVELDNRKVVTFEQLKEELQYYRAGDTVEMVVMRADAGEYKEVRLQVKLGSAEVLEKANTKQTERQQSRSGR